MAGTAERPRLPEGYGIPSGGEGMLRWAEIEARLAAARTYWLGTTGPDGAPHAVPVWGVWLDGQLLFGMHPETRTARNLARNPAVVVHLESGDAVAIVKGVVERVGDAALLRRSAALGAAKYGTPFEPEGAAGAAAGEAGGEIHRVFALRPRSAYAWNAFPADATRWRFGRD